MSETVKEGYSVPQFCDCYGISRALYYKLRKSGEGPPHLKLGNRTVIPREGAENWWRKLQEQAA